MSTRRALALAGFAALAACGRRDNGDVAVTNSLSHELEIAPADTATPAPSQGKTERKTRSGATRAAPAPTRATHSPASRVPHTARAPSSAPKTSSPPPAVADSTRTPDSASAPAPVSRTPPPESPAPSPALPAPAATAAAQAVAAGTQIRALLKDSITSLRNSEGQIVTAFVSGDVRAPDGHTVVPSGSPVALSITRLSPARTRSAKDGELDLRADSVMVAGHAYPVSAQVGPVPHELRGRGVTAGEAEKVAAGTAVGAVAGGVISGKTKGAVIGGAVGAAGGAVVAAQTASRDVVVAPNTPVVLILTAPLGR